MILFLSFITGITYSLGGRGRDFADRHRLPRWMFDRVLMRLFITPLIFCVALLFKAKFSIYPYLIIYGLSYGAMTTYGKIGKQEDVYWWNWLICGFLYGMVLLPLLITGSITLGFFCARTILLSVVTCLWSQAIGIAWLEDGGRGFLLTVSLLI